MKRAAIHPDHPDLPRLNDDALVREMEYTIIQINQASARIQKAITYLKFTKEPDLPLWRLREDLNVHMDRFEAIADEVRYRKDSMR